MLVDRRLELRLLALELAVLRAEALLDLRDPVAPVLAQLLHLGLDLLDLGVALLVFLAQLREVEGEGPDPPVDLRGCLVTCHLGDRVEAAAPPARSPR